MDTEFLVQMRQSNKCGSVRNDEIFNLHLGSGATNLQAKTYFHWQNILNMLLTRRINNELGM